MSTVVAIPAPVPDWTRRTTRTARPIPEAGTPGDRPRHPPGSRPAAPHRATARLTRHSPVAVTGTGPPRCPPPLRGCRRVKERSADRPRPREWFVPAERLRSPSQAIPLGGRRPATRQTHLETNAGFTILGAHHATVGTDELVDDIKPQAQAIARVECALEGFEQPWQQGIRDAAGVLYGKDKRVLAGAVDVDRYLRALAVLDGIAKQVGHHLPHAHLVEAAAQVARRGQVDHPLRVRTVHLRDPVLSESPEVTHLQVHGQDGRADAREVEHLLDHARHAVGADLHERCRSCKRGVGGFLLEAVGTEADGRKWRAQVVREHGDHGLVELEQMLELLVSFFEVKGLPIELDENAHLADDD